MSLNISKHLIRRKKLRVAADNCLLLFAVVRIENKVSQNLQNPVFGKYSLDHRKQRTDPVRNGIFFICFIPRIIELIWCKNRAKSGISAVANDRKRGIFQERRNVSGVTYGDLFPRIVDSFPLFYGAFKFKYTHRYTIDEDEHVGNTGMKILYNKLIDYLKAVIFRRAEINEIDVDTEF